MFHVEQFILPPDMLTFSKFDLNDDLQHSLYFVY